MKNKFWNEFKKVDWKKLILELIVVFLGVTAGFILNNSRAAEEDQQLELQYLQSFKRDTEFNVQELDDFIRDDSLWLSRNKALLNMLIGDSLTQDSAVSMLKYIASTAKPILKNNTYIDITNSGNLNIISNYQLKEDILSFYLDLEGSEYLHEYFFQYFDKHVMPHAISKFDMIHGVFIDKQAFKDKEFANIYTGYYSLVQQRKTLNDSLLVEGKNLVLTLENALKEY